MSSSSGRNFLWIVNNPYLCSTQVEENDLHLLLSNLNDAGPWTNTFYICIKALPKFHPANWLQPRKCLFVLFTFFLFPNFFSIMFLRLQMIYYASFDEHEFSSMNFSLIIKPWILKLCFTKITWHMTCSGGQMCRKTHLVCQANPKLWLATLCLCWSKFPSTNVFNRSLLETISCPSLAPLSSSSCDSVLSAGARKA